MKSPLFYVVVGVVCMGLVRCEAVPPQSSEPSTTGTARISPDVGSGEVTHNVAFESRKPVIFTADYTDSPDLSVALVRIRGRNFNTFLVTEQDCLQSLDGTSWRPCVKVIAASTIEYNVVIAHPAYGPVAFVKVRGQGAEYSAAAPVSKQRPGFPEFPPADKLSAK